MQTSDLGAWTDTHPFTEAGNAPGGVGSVGGGICRAQMEKPKGRVTLGLRCGF